MSVYKRGEVWWYKFRFNGQTVRESADTGSKTIARDAEHQAAGIGRRLEWHRRRRARLFSLASREWIDLKRSVLSPRSVPTTARPGCLPAQCQKRIKRL